MSRSYTTVTACRVCGCSELKPVLSLGDQFVSDFPDKAHLDSGIKCPIEIVACQRCTLVQQLHTAPQELLYSRHYWYRSGTTATMRAALQDVACSALKAAKLSDGDTVIDIGSNDGTLLRCFDQPGFPKVHKVGVEPADNLQDEGRAGVDQLIHDFWPTDKYRGERAKVITALGMFYDLDDPNAFIAGVAQNLARDGVFIAQLMCLQNMLAVSDLGNLCHEHLEFYTLRSLMQLYNKHGLVITDVETNDVNGQSYRIYAVKDGPMSLEGWLAADGVHRFKAALDAEHDILDRLSDFVKRMAENKRRVVEFVRTEVNLGKRVYAYGASTKGNVVLQYYSLDNSLIAGVAEKDPQKFGRYTVGSRIPIVPEEMARQHADYFFVLPYAFKQEFLERERDWRAKGGKFLFPLPQMEVV